MRCRSKPAPRALPYALRALRSAPMPFARCPWPLKQVLLEVGGVERAAGASIVLGDAGQDAGAPQAVEALLRGTWLASQDPAHDLAEIGIRSQQGAQPPQVVAVNPLAAARARLEVADADAVRRHFEEAAAHQVRVAAHQ